MILIYCGSVTVIAVVVAINNVVQKRKQRKQAIWVANWVRQLRCLLELLPKHRGMANALLKGDDSFRSSLEKLQKDVNAQLKSMRQWIQQRGDLSPQQLLDPIEHRWQAIREGVVKMPAHRSFALHTQLIALVIERMEDDSLELEALAHNHGQLRSLIAMLTRELPHVVESIGQARGIGTGVAAQRTSTVANRVNLKFLHGKTAAIIDNKLVPARSAMRQYQGMEAVIVSAVSSAQNFLQLLQGELIESASPSMSPEKFYQQGTAAIDAEFQLFDQLFPRCLQSMGLQ